MGETGFALSGGQRQRLAICRALYGTPKYIVMDEPNANLDEVGESALAQAITYLKSQGSAVIITTHRPRLVSVADNLLVLRNGSQVGFGPADEMINAVRNLQVVGGNKPGDDNADAQEVVAKEATNDAPVAASPDNGSATSSPTQGIQATEQAQPAQSSPEQNLSAVASPVAKVQVDQPQESDKPSSGNTPGAPS